MAVCFIRLRMGEEEGLPITTYHLLLDIFFTNEDEGQATSSVEVARLFSR